MAGQSDVTNEDAVLVYQPTDPGQARLDGSLYVIADGQGGAQRSRIASSYAAQKVMSSYYSSDEPDLGLRLQWAIQEANLDLFNHAKERPELVKLTTSLVAAVVRGEQLIIASVGSARAYLIRDGVIRQINHDHTLVQRLVDEGAITPDEARSHPRRDILLRSVGTGEEVEVDVFDLRLNPDDAILLSSNVLTRYLSEQEIAEIAATQQPRKAAETLALKTSDRGSKDDVTIVSALVRDGAPALAAELPFTWDGAAPSFEKDPTLAVRRPEIPEPPEVPQPEAAALPTTPAADDGWLTAGVTEEMTRPAEPVAAPSFDGREQAAPAFAAPTTPTPATSDSKAREAVAVTRQVGPTLPRGYQPPPGYEFDPVTGLPPTPTEKVMRPDRSRATSQQAAPRRGISLGAFLAVAALTILIVVGMVFLLVNPFNWDLKLANLFGGEDPTPTPTVTPQPTVEMTMPPAVVDVEPTPTEAPDLTAPAGMVLIAEGPYTRGAGQSEIDQATLQCIRETEEANRCYPEYFTDAQPESEITLTGFFMSQTEITNAAYKACVDAGTCTEPSDDTYYADTNYADHPVVFVNYQQAGTYCGWIGGRLPTEAEWEKAARFDPNSGESFWFPWGNQFAPGRANTLAAGLNGTSPVTSFPQDLSPLGLAGLAGNVSEWVADWYFNNYEGFGTLNPTGPDTQPLTEPFRVARGGSFLSLEPFARGAQRLDVPPATSAAWLGFRCVIDLPTTQPAVTETPTEEPTAAETDVPTATLPPTATP